MINKNYDLLGEQLAESGLELTWIGAAIGAVTGIVGGIMGSNQASDNNDRAEKNAEEQREAAEETAKLTNKHNKKLDKADKFNYFNERNFAYNNNIKSWERGAEIQDYNYLQSLKLYEKSEAIKSENFGLNSLAATQAIDSERAAIDDAFLAQQFQNETSLSSLKNVYQEAALSTKEQGLKSLQISANKDLGFTSLQNTIQQARGKTAMDKESALIEGLVAQGRASLGQAGVSSAKRQQSNTAALQRGLMALERQMTGEVTQAQIKMLELSADANLQQLGVGINLEKIANVVTNAEEEAAFNKKVSTANMKSFLDQSTRNIKQIELQQKYADINVEANSMLFPEPLSYNPRPELPPERMFVPRMEATAAYIPSPAQQSTMAPLVQGFGSAAAGLAGVDFTGGGGNGGGSNMFTSNGGAGNLSFGGGMNSGVNFFG